MPHYRTVYIEINLLHDFLLFHLYVSFSIVSLLLGLCLRSEWLWLTPSDNLWISFTYIKRCDLHSLLYLISTDHFDGLRLIIQCEMFRLLTLDWIELLLARKLPTVTFTPNLLKFHNALSQLWIQISKGFYLLTALCVEILPMSRLFSQKVDFSFRLTKQLLGQVRKLRRGMMMSLYTLPAMITGGRRCFETIALLWRIRRVGMSLVLRLFQW